jgi:hypothetical protein
MGTHPGERFAYFGGIKQPTLVVSSNHDVIVYDKNVAHYPEATRGGWRQGFQLRKLPRPSLSAVVGDPSHGLGDAAPI